jgi:hypothetical protein
MERGGDHGGDGHSNTPVVNRLHHRLLLTIWFATTTNTTSSCPQARFFEQSSRFVPRGDSAGATTSARVVVPGGEGVFGPLLCAGPKRYFYSVYTIVYVCVWTQEVLHILFVSC